ncbi:MAG TPA: pilus assembly PilX N-terminal domain-containing protein, partial [Candidatus Babeliales bacterium]|nr:pilus assembly PilX N-terminal domain-containing protein [Candidatus Babeliales bacterium]
MKRFRLSQFLIFNFLIFKRLRIKNYDLKIAGSQNQRGVIALITTIVVSLLLIVITASGIALMGSELRQASDYDQSVKAYFAAEAGVEDALAVLKRNGTDYANTINTYWADPDSCNYSIVPAGISSILDDNNQISYSCQIVSTKDNNVTGSLDKEAATQIDLNGISNTFRRLRLSWNQINSTDPSGWNPTQFPAGSKFPKGDQWADSSGKQFPAVMEVSVISYPTPGPGVTFNNNPRPDPNGIYKDSVGLRP